MEKRGDWEGMQREGETKLSRMKKKYRCLVNGNCGVRVCMEAEQVPGLPLNQKSKRVTTEIRKRGLYTGFKVWEVQSTWKNSHRDGLHWKKPSHLRK